MSDSYTWQENSCKQNWHGGQISHITATATSEPLAQKVIERVHHIMNKASDPVSIHFEQHKYHFHIELETKASVHYLDALIDGTRYSFENGGWVKVDSVAMVRG